MNCRYLINEKCNNKWGLTNFSKQQPDQSTASNHNTSTIVNLIDETEDENKEEPIPTPTSKKRSRGVSSSGSNPMIYQEKFMKEQYELDRKAKMQVIEQESEERRQLIHAQRIAEEMRVLQIDTRGMDPADAVIINAQKARIRAAYQPPSN
ncbi:hypothetical protein Tco_0532315 [Tanacetum coccineum]